MCRVVSHNIIMLLHCCLMLLLLNSVRTSTETVYDNGIENSVAEFDQRFSFWPSFHNAAHVMRHRKREVQEPVKQVGQSEGGVVSNGNQEEQKHAPQQPPQAPLDSPQKPPPASGNTTLQVKVPAPTSDDNKDEKSKPPVPDTVAPDAAAVPGDTAINSPAVNNNETHTNKTVLNKPTANQLDLNNPGVLKRGVIVFGGFLLLAVAYFIFYRRKSTKNDANNAHSASDTNQFRYGVLQSEDRRDNLELSRIPLTMESDDDEDDDLEIFDLEQKKKSLSYVNLQTNDEDIVFNNSTDSREIDKDNLLLDIEDPATDTLINWSSNGNKSIL